MKLLLPFFAIILWAQSAPVGAEPSRMEAFATADGSTTVWSREAGRLEEGGTHAVVTALITGNGAERMRGVMIDLTTGDAKDRIYLDEEATERTRAAMIEISDAVARHPMGNGCMGAREFWPGYNWPWNKYHELNVDYCGDALVLYGRGKEGSFRFNGKSPTDLAAIVAKAQGLLR